MLIGLLARRTYGKDTIADYLVENYGYKKVPLASPLKEACRVLFNFDDEQLYGSQKETIDPNWGIAPRQMFQYLGTDILRNDISRIMPDIKDNFWVNNIKIQYEKALEKDPNTRFIISDVRFQNEVDVIHQLGGKVVKIERNLNINDTTDTHESEKSIDFINNYDILVENTGTLAELYIKTDELVENNFE